MTMTNKDEDGNKAKSISKVSEKDIILAQKIRSIKHFLWNAENQEFLGRNGSSWLKITIFYIFFYIGLGGFFMLCMFIFETTLPEGRPKWILSESIIGTNPGLSMRPQPETDIIFLQNKKSCDESPYSIEIRDILKRNDASANDSNLLDCDYVGGTASESQACRFDWNSSALSEGCSEENHYGYHYQYQSKGLCILLKLNKIIGWVPEAYGIENDKFNSSVLERDLNSVGMPQELVDYILTYSEKESIKDQEASYLKNVWITCEERAKSTKTGNVSFVYYPSREIPGYYFPFHSQKSYQTPFIFVKVNFLDTIKDEVIKIDCTAWAKNIRPEKFTKAGMTRFMIQRQPK